MSIFDRLLLIAATLVLAISPLSAAVACDLQPANKNPAEVPGIEMTRLAQQVNATFTAGGASERYYDHVEPLDGMTMAFGHWPQNEVAKVFEDMKASNGGKAFAAFADCMTEFFARKENANAWRRAQQAARVASADAIGEHVAAVLDKTLLSPVFMNRYKKNCRKICSGEPDLYREQKDWLVPALRYALRDRAVIEWQVDFWNRDIINDAVDLAKLIGLEGDEAAIVAAAAYDSSSPRWFKDVISATKIGRLSYSIYQWNWNDPPRGARRDSEGLKEWRRFILWQYYAARVWDGRKQIRDRSIKFFELYLAKNWVLPGLDKDGKIDRYDRSNLDPVLVKPILYWR